MSLDYNVSCTIQYYIFKLHMVEFGSHVSEQAHFSHLYEGSKLE